MLVLLEDHEVMQATIAAMQMQLMNTRNNAQPTYGAPKKIHQALSLSIVGMLGEVAVAKALNKYWTGNIGNYKAKDVDSYQVRTSAHDSLRVSKRDADNDTFILVVAGNNFTFNVAGWAYGRDVKQDKYWREPVKGRPNYFMPVNDLNPLEVLP